MFLNFLFTYLVNLALQQEQFDERGRMLDGFLDELQGLLVVAEVVVVLRKVVQHPELRRGRLEAVGLVVKRSLGLQVLEIRLVNVLEDLGLVVGGVERPQIHEQRRNSLAQSLAQVRVHQFAELVTWKNKTKLEAIFKKKELP